MNLSHHQIDEARKVYNLYWECYQGGDLDGFASRMDDKIGEIPIVAEDFSRVILNLCNNGFDAMREKEKLTGDGGPKTGKKSLRQPTEGGDPSADGEQGDDTESGYHPKLTVRTDQSGKSITIEIEDNGPGIPDEIRDKIMQPFFTTKKGTQGTGLGLSITNDIVKAHGGTMNIDSQPGQTIFTIKFNR
jgi:signal transduction histidine kinase